MWPGRWLALLPVWFAAVVAGHYTSGRFVRSVSNALPARGMGLWDR
jgi:hypothetical protein